MVVLGVMSLATNDELIDLFVNSQSLFWFEMRFKVSYLSFTGWNLALLIYYRSFFNSHFLFRWHLFLCLSWMTLIASIVLMPVRIYSHLQPIFLSWQTLLVVVLCLLSLRAVMSKQPGGRLFLVSVLIVGVSVFFETQINKPEAIGEIFTSLGLFLFTSVQILHSQLFSPRVGNEERENTNTNAQAKQDEIDTHSAKDNSIGQPITSRIHATNPVPQASVLKEVAIMVVRLEDFVSFSRAIAPEELVKVLQKICQRIEPIATEHWGLYNGIWGNSLVITFKSSENRVKLEQVRSALSCARKTLAKLKDFFAQCDDQRLAGLRINIALESGYMVDRSQGVTYAGLLASFISQFPEFIYESEDDVITIGADIHQFLQQHPQENEKVSYIKTDEKTGKSIYRLLDHKEIAA